MLNYGSEIIYRYGHITVYTNGIKDHTRSDTCDDIAGIGSGIAYLKEYVLHYYFGTSEEVDPGVDRTENIYIRLEPGYYRYSETVYSGETETANFDLGIISGTDISKLDETKLAIFRRRQIGLIYQFYNLIPILNVEENMTLPILLDGKKPDQAVLSDLVEKLGLSSRLMHLPNQLSGGQQQRVSIGRALMNHPALLLADEPTGNLDSENSKEIVSLLRKFNKENKQTVIIITHDERIALSADRVITIEDGRITRDSKGAEVSAL
jgi:putative ABC transport system ATP-binding protein